jgi:hypothetical protein
LPPLAPNPRCFGVRGLWVRKLRPKSQTGSQRVPAKCAVLAIAPEVTGSSQKCRSLGRLIALLLVATQDRVRWVRFARLYTGREQRQNSKLPTWTPWDCLRVVGAWARLPSSSLSPHPTTPGSALGGCWSDHPC